jgi:hypothetical protein
MYGLEHQHINNGIQKGNETTVNISNQTYFYCTIGIMDIISRHITTLAYADKDKNSW